MVGDIEFPATSGTATGWFGLLLVVLGIYLALANASGLGLVRAVLALLLVAVLVYAYLMRPRVRIQDDALLLVNPLSTVSVPLAVVSYVSVRSVTKVTVGDKRWTAVGVGRRVREMARPTQEGAVPTAGSWIGRLGSAARFTSQVESSRPKAADVADLLEDTVARAVLQVRDARPAGQEPPPVRRTWEVAVVAPALVLLVALVVTLLL